MASRKKIALTKEGVRYNYTPIEQKLFSCLSEKSPIDTAALAEKCFDGGLFDRANVVSRMRTLKEKVAINKEKFRIEIEGGRGRGQSNKYWIETV